MIPGVASKETVRWAAQQHYPYVMLATLLGPTKEMFDYYFQCAEEFGYKAGPQNLGYLFKVHADETEQLADEVGRRYISGVENPFIAGNTAAAPLFTGLPGLSSADSRRRQAALFGARTGGAASTASTLRAPYETQVEQYSIVSGTPKAVLAKLRHVLEFLRPGTLYIWDGDGAMTHDDQMRSFRLMGSEVLPALREMGKELGLVGPFESNDGTGIGPDVWAKRQQQAKA
jgi:alkanesulfonate monooxygenase SsuD/methylene tetrahydromethanopterin reductase-like flavin-dependent oxidoreductase (luciferase family)